MVIEQILASPESATIEFKRRMYRIDDADPETKKHQRDELIKDILSLANGNAIVAGEPAYLVIGADDQIGSDGKRTLYDVSPTGITRQKILALVNSACEPAIEDIEINVKKIDGKRILFIVIPPTPYLHETTRRLTPQSGVFSERVVFVRHNENIMIASQKERDAIIQLKHFRFRESRNPPADIFGAVAGAVVGGTMTYAVVKNRHSLDDLPQAEVGAGIAGLLTGAFIGGSLGRTYIDYFEIRSNINNIPRPLRLPLVIFSIGFGIVVSKVLGSLLSRHGA